MAEDNIFNTAAETPSESYVNKLVGEGKKYKDVEELAKAYANADNFIGTLKEETGDLREFIQAQFKERAATPTEPTVEPTPQRQDPPSRPSEPENRSGDVDIKALIKEALDAKTSEDRAKKNSEVTERAAIAKFGTKEAAVEAIQRKAQEMDVSPQFIADMAFTSPTAFFKLMEIDQRSVSSPAPRSDVNPQMFSSNTAFKPGTEAYYNNLRKTDPKTYWLPATQKALMEDALEKGDAFFER